MIKNDLLVLDVSSKNYYAQDTTISIRIPADISDVQGDTKFYSFSRNELSHLSKFEKSLDVNDDYSFKGQVLHGKLGNPFTELDYSYLPEMFDSLPEPVSSIEISGTDFEIIKKASFFTNPIDEKLTCQCVNINEQITSANSFNRTYYSSNNLGNISILLNPLALKSLLFLGSSTLIKDYENSILMDKDSISILLQKVDTGFIPITEMLAPVVDKLLQSNHIVLDKQEFTNATLAMSLYAKKNLNNRIALAVTNGNIVLSVDENSVDVNIQPDSNIVGEVSFNLNLDFLIQAISLIESEKIDLYESSQYKIYCLVPVDGEIITLGKLVS